jgi:hypothetical protein
MPSAATSTLDNDDDDAPLVVETISVADYLQQVMDAVVPFSMCVTEQHRKTMIRCLMGYHEKADFDAKWHNLHTNWQWEKASHFVSQHLIQLATQVDHTKVPMFREGIEMHQRRDPQFFSVPYNTIKFFSFLARGRTYQGKMERLLEDVAPHLLETYDDILRPPDDVELFRRLVHEETSQDSPAMQWKDQLLELVEKEFGLKPPSPYEDSGKQVGIQGELDMATYLQERIGQDSSPIVLTNVLVKPINKHLQHNNQHNNSSKRLPHVIASNVDLRRATSEFDAMVVEVTDDNTIRIVELWEAKASLHPVTIYDGIVKKMGALHLILDDPSTLIYFYPRNNLKLRQALGHPGIPLNKSDEPLVFPFANRAAETSTSTAEEEAHHHLPKLGMFGMELVPPEKAAKKIQIVHCEALLEKDPQVVVAALATGLVEAPDVKPTLQSLMDKARRLQAMMVVLPSADGY